ncbi:MAG: 2Fe-2S iron-sulfur cluster-binding protein [bacterium]|nr:2Fe-2S iron-sulfur cluster-binding protein [bacterium]
MQISFEKDGQFEVPDERQTRPAVAEAGDSRDGPQTLLEISLANEIPHTHACGGHARCSTCRVLVLEHPENLTPPTEAERELARRKGLEPGIRLACQACPTGPVRVRRLVIDREDAEIAIAEGAPSSGREQHVAVLFSDLRGFTAVTENMLPYDVIHVLNRYFRKMGEAILANHGFIDKYMGDGIMAIFGIESAPADAALPTEESSGDASQSRARTAVANAIRAGLDMQAGLAEFNVYMREHFDHEFRMGIGIHYGEAIVGEVGHPRSMQFSALGDTVNMASRVESACKRAQAEFLISEATREHAPDLFRFGRRFSIQLKGKAGRHILSEVLGPAATPGSEQSGEALVSDSGVDLATRIRRELRRRISRDQSPQYLRLLFHDAASARVDSGTGGCDGSVRFEMDRAQNENLRGCARVLTQIQTEFALNDVEVSFADLLVFAGALAVEICEGPQIPLETGRRDAEGPTPEGFIPEETDALPTLVERFAAMGLNTQDLVVLSGAHTLGRANEKPYTADLYTFSNTYFQRLALEESPAPELSMLATDLALLQNPEARELVMTYARDEERFHRDFARAFRKMTRGSLKSAE